MTAAQVRTRFIVMPRGTQGNLFGLENANREAQLKKNKEQSEFHQIGKGKTQFF